MSYTNLNNPANYQLQSFGQDGMRTISTTQAYVEGEYYRVLVATEDSTLSATSMVGDDLASIDVYAGTTIYGLFTAVTVTAGEVTAYLAGRTDIDDVWAYIRAYGVAGGATIEGEDCAKAAISPLLDKYYAKASLVMVPSLYKTSIVYSERPLSTDGELTFTRASSATRVASNGLLEKVRTNLLLYSEQFDNASWVKTGDGQVTITANAAVAPNGTTTADKMIPSAIAGFHCVQQAVTLSAGEASVSVYAKAVENSFLQIFDALTGEFVNFNLTTGAVGSSSVYVGSIEDAGNGWYRCKATKVVPSGNFTPRFGVVTSATAVRGESFTGNGTDGLLIWGAQLEYGVATDYIPTTTTAVSVGPVANLPRLNYPINSDGSVGCPSLLLEPQRTNLVLFSEQMTLWTNGTASVTANATTSPDGYQNADSINNTADVSTFVGASNVAHTFSLFVKQGTSATASIDMSDGATGDVITTFTFATKTFSGTSAGGSWTSPSTAYQDYGNGWYRISLTATKGAGSTIGHKIIASGTGTTFIWGAQLEAGAYATSYIPTLGAAVTRGLDACSKTGISSLIGQTEGTLFVEADLSNVVDPLNIRGILEVNDGTTSNRFSIYRGANDLSLNVIVFTAAAAVANIAASTITGPTKIAVAYNSSDVTVYINGSLIGTDTSVTIPACSDLDLGIITTNTTRILGDGINQALLFKTRLTNAQLAELTTL